MGTRETQQTDTSTVAGSDVGLSLLSFLPQVVEQSRVRGGGHRQPPGVGGAAQRVGSWAEPLTGWLMLLLSAVNRRRGNRCLQFTSSHQAEEGGGAGARLSPRQ